MMKYHNSDIPEISSTCSSEGLNRSVSFWNNALSPSSSPVGSGRDVAAAEERHALKCNGRDRSIEVEALRESRENMIFVGKQGSEEKRVATSEAGNYSYISGPRGYRPCGVAGPGSHVDHCGPRPNLIVQERTSMCYTPKTRCLYTSINSTIATDGRALE